MPFHEEYTYALDCFPMMVALLILAIWHPGRYLVGPDSEFPKVSRKEKKAAKAERKAAKREEKEALKMAKRQGKHQRHESSTEDLQQPPPPHWQQETEYQPHSEYQQQHRW